MALPGELQGLKGMACPDCGWDLDLDVYQSAAGYYLGYFCDNCGPMSRETGYYGSRREAEHELALARDGFTPLKLRDTEYRG